MLRVSRTIVPMLWVMASVLVGCASSSKPGRGKSVPTPEAASSAVPSSRGTALEVLPQSACRFGDGSPETAPEWVCRPVVPGVHVTALGVYASMAAPMGPRSSEEQALWSGRVELAQRLHQHVMGLLQQYMEVTKVAPMTQLERLNAGISAACAADRLTGVNTVGTVVSGKGTVYVLAALPPSVVRDNTVRILLDSMKRDASIWRTFKTRKTSAALADAIASARLRMRRHPKSGR